VIGSKLLFGFVPKVLAFNYELVLRMKAVIFDNENYYMPA